MEALEHLKPATEAPDSPPFDSVLISLPTCHRAQFLHTSRCSDGVVNRDGVAPEASRHQQHRGHEANVFRGTLPRCLLPRRRDMERGGDVPHDFLDVQEAVDALLLGNDIIDHRHPHLLGFTDHQRRDTPGEYDDQWRHVVRRLGFHGLGTVCGALLATSSPGHHPEGVTPSLVDDHRERRHDTRHWDRAHRRDSFETPRVSAFHGSLQVSNPPPPNKRNNS